MTDTDPAYVNKEHDHGYFISDSGAAFGGFVCDPRFEPDGLWRVIRRAHTVLFVKQAV